MPSYLPSNVRILTTVTYVILLLCIPPISSASVCGDGEPDTGEQCDDANLANGDGCSATCQVEAGFECTEAIGSQSTENLLVNGSFESGVNPWNQNGTPFNPICSPNTCGNGSDFSLEQQGGGWFLAGGASTSTTSTASQTLIIPTDATSITFAIWPAACVPEGGSGDTIRIAIDGNEVFNSGVCNSSLSYNIFPDINLATAPGGPYNDGSAHVIAVTGILDFTSGDPESGRIYVDDVSVTRPLSPPVPALPSACTFIFCGDGVLSGTEQCDDGNTFGGDGCSASCQIEIADTDNDGITDDVDNCTLVPNTDQRDTNGDGFGNICDPDLNNDGIVNVIDMGAMRAVFFTADADADLNGDGVVNFVDFSLMQSLFYQPPGPSGLTP